MNPTRSLSKSNPVVLQWYNDQHFFIKCSSFLGYKMHENQNLRCVAYIKQHFYVHVTVHRNKFLYNKTN